MSPKPAALPSGWNSSVVPLFFQQMSAVAEADIRKLIHDPVELLTRMVQPVLWLTIFGQVFARTRAIPTGGVPYLDFMAPGILAQSVLFGSIFFGISLIWERDLGIVHKFLVSPAPRTALVLGRAVSSAIRAICQAVMVYIVALLLGIHLRFHWDDLLGVLVTISLGASVFSTFSLIAACIVKSRERFMGIGQVLTMPLFFASNAIYPLEMMPPWLRVVANVNPLTYVVDALRGLMIQGGQSVYGMPWDCAVLALTFLVLLVIAVRTYPHLIQ